MKPDKMQETVEFLKRILEAEESQGLPGQHIRSLTRDERFKQGYANTDNLNYTRRALKYACEQLGVQKVVLGASQEIWWFLDNLQSRKYKIEHNLDEYLNGRKS